MWNGAAEVPLTKGRTHRSGHLLLHLASTWSVRLTSNYRTFALMFCSQAHPVGDPNRTCVFFLNVICHLYLSSLNIGLLALRGLCCRTRVFSSGGVMGSRCGGFSGCGACALERTGCSSCSTACGVSPDQGRNQCPLHHKVGSQTGPPGKSGVSVCNKLGFRKLCQGSGRGVPS